MGHPDDALLLQLRRAEAECRAEGRAVLQVPINCSDARLATADLTLTRSEGSTTALSIHTGMLLGRRAHAHLDGIMLQKLRTEPLEDVVRWVSHADLLHCTADSLFPEPAAAAAATAAPCRAWIYFAHICSPAKVRQAVCWGTALSLSGLLVPGEPGCLVLEGAQPAVECAAGRLSLFSWRDMKVVMASPLRQGQSIPWRGVREVAEVCPSAVRPGGGSKGRDSADYGALAEGVCKELQADLLVLLPVFAAGQVPQADAPFPRAPPAPAATKKKKSRLQ